MRHLLAIKRIRPIRFISLDRIKMSNEVELAKLAAEAQKVSNEIVSMVRCGRGARHSGSHFFI